MAQLTTRERFVRTLTGQDVDRVPFMKVFGGDAAALPTWVQKYPLLPTYIDELMGFEGGYRGWRVAPVNTSLCGVEPSVIVSEDEREFISRSGEGTVRRGFKKGDYHGHVLEYPVKTEADWDRIKEKYLDPYDPRRIPADWPNLVELYKNRDFPLQLTCGGVYGFLRHMMGDEALCLAMYDDPNLVSRIIGEYIDMNIALWEILCRDVQFDLIECWEDMASKTGSIISPASFEQFMAPRYRKIRAFADEYNIPIVLVDSDGNIDELAHWMAGCGVNSMYPFEVMAGCNPKKVLAELPGMSAIGCLEKSAGALGEAYIEEQLELARALIKGGRCIPGPDHFPLENVTFEDYKRFLDRVREVIMTTKPGS